MHLYDYLGGLIQVQKMTWPLFGAFAYNGHRGLLHEILFEHAKSLGIEIRMGHQVVEYWEDEANAKAGVKIQTGETFDADVIVAADGVKSLARKYVIVSFDLSCRSTYRSTSRRCTAITQNLLVTLFTGRGLMLKSTVL